MEGQGKLIFAENSPVTKKRQKSKSDQLGLFLYDPEEIARQLTLIEHSRIQQLDPKDLLHLRWLDGTASPIKYVVVYYLINLAYLASVWPLS